MQLLLWTVLSLKNIHSIYNSNFRTSCLLIDVIMFTAFLYELIVDRMNFPSPSDYSSLSLNVMRTGWSGLLIVVEVVTSICPDPAQPISYFRMSWEEIYLDLVLIESIDIQTKYSHPQLPLIRATGPSDLTHPNQ